MQKMKPAFVITAVLIAIAFGMNGCGSKGGKLIAITVSPTEAMIAKGTGQQFTATAIFSDGTVLDWSSAATWSTSDQAVSIGNNFGSYGMATSLLSSATASINTITVTATDLPNNISGTAVLTVVDPDSLSVKPANPFMAVNTGRQFRAEAVLSNGTRTVTQDLTSHATWTTADPSVATITGTGYLSTSPTLTGTTDIIALYSAATGTTRLTVTSSAVQTIAVSALNASIFQNDTQQFNAEGTYLDAPPSDFTASVTWTSSDSDVAGVSNSPGSQGLVTAGTVTGAVVIKATDPVTGLSGSKELTVQ